MTVSRRAGAHLTWPAVGFNRSQFLALGTAWLAATRCAPPQQVGQAVPPSGDEPIPLGPQARIRATLTSTEPDTLFVVSGTGADDDLLLPRSNIVRVRLPPTNLTIKAQAPCFRDTEHFVQAGGMSDSAEIAFSFSNYDRDAACPDDAAEPWQPGADPDTATNSTRLAWVIANRRYGNDWPQLPFVETDRERMTTTLRRCGYDVMVSSNRPLAALSADAAAFRTRLARRLPEIAVVYLSGHGMAVNGTNYLVPVDAPTSTAAREADLFSMSEIVRSLQAVPAAGGLAVVLVDACRASRDGQARALVAEAPDRVLVNHSAAPGRASFDSDRAMSAWTERFVAIADAFPDAGFDQILGYANRYVKWQSEASLRVQAPVLYGIRPGSCPAFGIRRAVRPPGVLPHISA